MPRVKLNPLAKYSFSTEIKVRITDLNYGGHLGNDSLLSMIHEARVAFLANYGFSEENCGGVSLIIGDTAVVYQNEAFAGDVLRFEVAAEEPTRCGFRLFFRITRPADEKTIALVENGMVCFDYQTRSAKPLPKTAQTIFETTD
ncbi:MAG: thioesterase family protein [Candidatus Aminicenantes bacterium]|nr:MAG: thioesterase family protein [Candidatus Aminicenantes bacterium]